MRYNKCLYNNEEMDIIVQQNDKASYSVMDHICSGLQRMDLNSAVNSM